MAVTMKETDCLPSYISKGIAMGCFYYARCLHEGHGVTKDIEKAKLYYSKVFVHLLILDHCVNLHQIWHTCLP